MFETAVTANIPAKTRVWTTICGFAGQAFVLTLAVLIPMALPDALPGVRGLITNVFTFTPPPHPPDPVPLEPRIETAAVIPTQTIGLTVFAPTKIPDKPVTIIDPPEMANWNARNVAAGPANWAELAPRANAWNEIVQIPVVAAPVERPLPAAPKRVREGGLVNPAVPVVRVDPVYPEVARRIRVAGVVEIEGVIGLDGRIHEARVLNGNPLLVEAALHAVRNWVYRPALLNGDPVEVITNIKVAFTLK